MQSIPDGATISVTGKTGSMESAYGICRIGDTYVGVPIEALVEVFQVSTLSSVLVDSEYLSGAIDLRGQLLPVINMPRICGLSEHAQMAAFAVVLRLSDRHLSFLVDQVMGISHVQEEQIQTLAFDAGAVRGCVRRVFLQESRTVSILDVDSVFSLPGVVAVMSRPSVSGETVIGARTPMLSFVAGGACYAVAAVDVYGTVPRQAIETGAMTQGYCLGSITYHERRVPVLNTVEVLGVGRAERPAASEVVVLRCPQDRLLGLAVDAILAIHRTDSAAHAPLPRVISRNNNFLTGVVIQADDSQMYVLSAERLLQDKGVAAIAALSSQAVSKASSDAVAEQNRRLNGRYLVIETNRTAAVPLEQVTSIISKPANIIPAFRPEAGLIGYFARPPHTVPLVDLTQEMSPNAALSGTTWVLLTGQGEEQVGFLVKRVFSIESANWSLGGLKRSGPKSDTLVQLRHGDSPKAIPMLDLQQIVAKHFALLPVAEP